MHTSMVQHMIDIILFSIPESIVIFCLVASILGEWFSVQKTLIMGLLFGIATYSFRLITGSFIMNIVISGITIIVLLKIVATIPVFEAAASGLLAISTYLSIEFVNIKTGQVLSGMNPMLIETHLLLKVLWFLPQILVMIGLQMLIGHFTRSKKMIKTKNLKGIQ